MSDRIHDLLKSYAEGIYRILGDALDAVILYGSYARGDYTEDSDIDIMVLVSPAEVECREKKEELSSFTYDFNMEHDVQIMPIMKQTSQFLDWLPVHPFYQNVEREGVNLYVA